MAIQILNRPPSFGEEFGTALGEGIGGGLQALTQGLVKRQQQQQSYNFWKQLMPEANPQIISWIASRPSEIQKEFLDRLEGISLGAPQQQRGLQTLEQPEVPTQQASPGIQPVGGEFQPQVPSGAPILGPSSATRRHRENIAVRERSAAAREESVGIQKEKEARSARKEMRDFAQPYINNAKAAEENIRDWKSIMKAAKSGNLRSGNIHIIAQKLGIEKIGRNFATQLVEKSLERLARNAPAAFPTARNFSARLIDVFKGGMATLANTPEGVAGIAELSMIADQIPQIENDARKELYKKWRNRLPEDAQDQIDNKIKSKRQKLNDEFQKTAERLMGLLPGVDTEEEIPEGQKVRDENGNILIKRGGKLIPVQEGI